MSFNPSLVLYKAGSGGSKGFFADVLAGGTEDAYTISLDPPASQLIAGMVVWGIAPADNTDPVTLNVDTLGPKTIEGGGAAIPAGTLKMGDGYCCMYDGAAFQLISGLGPAGPQGFQGFQGFRGYQGYQGYQGCAPHMWVSPGGISCAEGSPCDATWSLTKGSQDPANMAESCPYELQIDFTISRGFQGWQGNQGYQGIQGPQGYQGPQGNDGVGTQGPQGPQGSKMAIVRAQSGNVALFCAEMPDVRFEEVLRIEIEKEVTVAVIDKTFMDVCAKDTIVPCGFTSPAPAKLGVEVMENIIIIRAEEPYPSYVIVRLSGLRKGHENVRFPQKTDQEMASNNQFWAQAYRKK